MVHKALWTLPESLIPREVAVKELLLSFDDLGNEALQEFLSEIKLMSLLKHPNVAEFLGICVAPGGTNLYLVTELMHRGNLRDVIDRKGQNLDWQLRWKLAKDAAKGMEYLHSVNLIHRDLKPQNLLVNEKWECKVADFGISTISGHTTKMTCIGTPVYMAPEVLTKDKYSTKADVYSFAVLLLEIYSGNIPYSDLPLNQAQLMYKIISEGLRPAMGALPAPLQLLIQDCWDENAPLRPSFSEVIVRLDRLKNLSLPPSKTIE